MKKWYGKICFEGEGVVTEKAYNTKAEARAYSQGVNDMIFESDQSPDSALSDYYSGQVLDQPAKPDVDNSGENNE